MIMPEPVDPEPGLGGSTRFYFPFDNPRKEPDVAYDEIAHGLQDLSETTTLFLKNIQRIDWMIEGEIVGSIMREDHEDHVVQVSKRTRGKPSVDKYLLKFDAPVRELSTQVVSVAYDLSLLPDQKTYAANKPAREQFEIKPAKRGRVAVFFPAKKETSGLKFHLHAPFVPELSRASIKNSSVNEPLFDQLSELTVTSLEMIKELGFLKPSFLSVLPNDADDLSERYDRFRTEIIEAMTERSLTPTYDGSHAPAKHLRQSRASFKKLVSKTDLGVLLDTKEPVDWVAGATQKNNRLDRFLQQLEIKEFDIHELMEVFEDGLFCFRAEDDDTLETGRLVPWLNEKGTVWLQNLYAHAYRILSQSDELYLVSDISLVRVSDGRYVIGDDAYFPGPHAEVGDFAIVDPRLLEFKGDEKLEKSVTDFLNAIGVQDIDEKDLVKALLREKYSSGESRLDPDDLRAFMKLVGEKDISSWELSSYRIFLGADGKMRQASLIYLDKPFEETGLQAFYSQASGLAALHENYLKIGLDKEELIKFCKAIGVRTTLTIQKRSTWSHPNSSELREDWYRHDVRRSHHEVDEDWIISDLNVAFQNPSIDLSLLIWNTMRQAKDHHLIAKYRPNGQFSFKRFPSSLVLLLRHEEWIPQEDGRFVCPREASRDKLPIGFEFGNGWNWLEAIEFGKAAEDRSEEARKRKEKIREMGFDDEEAYEDAQWFANLDVSERRRLRESVDPFLDAEFPESETGNPERRRERVAHQAANAPNRISEVRERSVSVNRDEVKAQAKQYLRQQYTDDDGETFCQACHKPLPFEVDGEGWFEAVEFLPIDKGRLHYQNYLALCPNHAAMYQYANESKEALPRAFRQMLEDELELGLVLAGRSVRLRFTNDHLLDLEQVLSVDMSGNVALEDGEED